LSTSSPSAEVLPATIPSECQVFPKDTLGAEEAPPAVPGDLSTMHREIARLYQAAQGATLWLHDGIATPQARVLAERLSQASSKGLSPDAYDGVDWGKLLQDSAEFTGPIRECRDQTLDLALSEAVMRYIFHLRMGRVDPRKLEIGLDVEPKRFDLAGFLLELARSPGPGALLDGLEPPFPSYRALVQALQRYRDLAADRRMQTPLASVNGALHPGEHYRDALQLAYRLERWGDLPKGRAGAFKGTLYTKELAQGVKRFQGRHGLRADGALGPDTFREINVPMTERVRQIQLSLERWRWMPDDLGHRPIFVNVPEYKLYALEGDAKGGYQLDLEMNVIVGETYPKHRTPLFHSAMRYLVFAPYWNVPISIVRRELYEKLKRDPGYASRHNYEIVKGLGPREPSLPVNEGTLAGLWRGTLRLRQRPGTRNALGEVKFMFPNDHSVYLHGTPKKGLFAKDKRALSHGCVRVADAARLAAYVLNQEPGWDRARVDALIASGKNHRVNLSVPLDVYLLYGTAVAEPDGTVRFFRDVYGDDERLSQALERVGGSAPAI